MKAIALWLLVAVLVIGSLWLTARNWKECRAAGFSGWYCVQQLG